MNTQQNTFHFPLSELYVNEPDDCAADLQFGQANVPAAAGNTDGLHTLQRSRTGQSTFTPQFSSDALVRQEQSTPTSVGFADVSACATLIVCSPHLLFLLGNVLGRALFGR